MMDKDWSIGHIKRVLLCIIMSVFVHMLTVLGLLLLPEPDAPNRGSTQHESDRHSSAKRNIRIHRTQEAKQETPHFAKTSPEAQQEKPDKAEFEGRHNTQASGDNAAPRRQSDAPVPTMQGEDKKEIVTFDQERQEGALEHEGKQDTTPSPPQPIAVPSPHTGAPSSAASIGAPDNTANHHTNLGDGENNNSPEATHSAKIPIPTPEGDTLLQTRQEKARQQPVPSPPSARRGLRHIPTPTPHQSKRLPRRSVIVHDPSLADHAQQPAGFRTRERRSRSTGRFVMGRKPSLNVAATPRGRYEAEIYRRIARLWYAACDEHRGDIIPGSLTISLRINKQGRLRNMQLISRHGAGVIQQSFTLGAIRRATLPPMPPNVSADVVGDILELIIEFNFDT
ncbi:MAG: hypothetical protein IJO34_03710 [Akkermansia sp.]|nr:hypothetical protein [Akkermansia sp.]